MKVQFYPKKAPFRRKQWRARLVSSGQITFVSSEGYNNLRDVESAVLTLGLPDSLVVEYSGFGTSDRAMTTTMAGLRRSHFTIGEARTVR